MKNPMPAGRQEKFLIISILIAAVLISGSIFYYTTTVKNSKTPHQTATVYNPVPQASTDDPFLGDKNAPVTIIEYSSYFCGHCNAFHKEKLPQLKKDYIDTGKVKFISRTFPPELAEATLCAGEQKDATGKSKYWEFSDYLFEHSEDLINNIKKAEDINPLMIKAAKELGLDERKFSDCLISKKFKAQIEQWINDAQTAKIEGTPTFFINDEEVIGNQPYEVFSQTIDKFLKE